MKDENHEDLSVPRKLLMKATYHSCKILCHVITLVILVFPTALTIYFAVYFGQYLTGSQHSSSFTVGGGDYGDGSMSPQQATIIQLLLQQIEFAWNITRGNMYLPPPTESL